VKTPPFRHSVCLAHLISFTFLKVMPGIRAAVNFGQREMTLTAKVGMLSMAAIGLNHTGLFHMVAVQPPKAMQGHCRLEKRP